MSVLLLSPEIVALSALARVAYRCVMDDFFLLFFDIAKAFLFVGLYRKYGFLKAVCIYLAIALSCILFAIYLNH